MATKFIADSMLGKLARWLRLMGFDTLYYPSIPDNELVKKACQERRIVLTKDNELIRNNTDAKIIRIVSPDPNQQLKTVVNILNLDPWRGLFSRCVHCNELVERVKDLSGFNGKIPAHVRESCTVFFRCPDCNRIYWEGSHHKKIKNKIKNLLEE